MYLSWLRTCQVSYISLSDCFLSLTIGSAYSFGFTVRSSTTKCHELGGQFRASYFWVLYCQTVTVYYSERYFCLEMYTDQSGLHITPLWLCKSDQSGLHLTFIKGLFKYRWYFTITVTCYLARFTLLLIVGRMNHPSGTSLVSKFPVVY